MIITHNNVLPQPAMLPELWPRVSAAAAAAVPRRLTIRGGWMHAPSGGHLAACF